MRWKCTYKMLIRYSAPHQGQESFPAQYHLSIVSMETTDKQKRTIKKASLDRIHKIQKKQLLAWTLSAISDKHSSTTFYSWMWMLYTI